MYIFDLLYYFIAQYFEKLNLRYGLKRVDPAAGGRNFIFISTFLWIYSCVVGFNFLFFSDSRFPFSWPWTLLASICLFSIINYVYIEKKRYEMLIQREKNVDGKFRFSKKLGTTIAVLYVCLSPMILYVILIYRIISKL